MRGVLFERAAKPLMLAFVALTALVGPSCGPRTPLSDGEASLAPSAIVAQAPSSAAPSAVLGEPIMPAAPAALEGAVEGADAAALEGTLDGADVVMAVLTEIATPAAAEGETAPAAPSEGEALVSEAASEPAPSQAAETAPEPAVEPVMKVVPAFAGGWQPADVARRAFRPEIERWRQLVREEIAQAWAEGRLGGGAARLDDDLILAMMQQESGGEPTAQSWAGALGLLQLMPETFAELITGDYKAAYSTPLETFLDPRLNVRAGVRYMAGALQAHRGDTYWALASYNAGIGATQAWRNVGLTAVPPIGGYTETAAYAPIILNTYAYHRPGSEVRIPDPIPAEQIPAVIAMLTNAGLW